MFDNESHVSDEEVDGVTMMLVSSDSTCDIARSSTSEQGDELRTEESSAGDVDK